MGGLVGLLTSVRNFMLQLRQHLEQGVITGFTNRDVVPGFGHLKLDRLPGLSHQNKFVYIRTNRFRE